MNPIRVTKSKACELLDIKPNHMTNLVKNDPSFPRPYKYGNTRQASVYFDYADLVEWHNAQKAKAAAEA